MAIAACESQYASACWRGVRSLKLPASTWMKAVVSMRSTNGDAAKQLAIPMAPIHRDDLNAIRKSIEATCADTGRTTRPPPAPHVPASLLHRPAGNPHSSDSSAVYKDEAASVS